MNLYYLIYYKIYKTTFKSNKDVVEWTSMVFLSVLVFFNLITLFSFVYPHIKQQMIGKNLFIGSMLGVIVFNYFIFIYNRKYKKIISDYSEKKWPNNFWAGVFTLSYIVSTVVLMFCMLRNM